MNPVVLIVDDDIGTCETFKFSLEHDGCVVLTAGSVAEGISCAERNDIDFLLVDLRLTDGSGLDLVRSARKGRRHRPPFVLMSGYLTVAISVEAMKLGAIDVLEKPVSVDYVSTLLRGVAGVNRPSRRVSSADSPLQDRTEVSRPRSAPERLASHVLRALEAPHDLKTLNQWARFVGVSYTSLCEVCRLAQVQPHDARDFMRLLRAVLKASAAGSCNPELYLDIGDARTLRTLFRRAGFEKQPNLEATPAAFLHKQTFLNPHNEPLLLIKRALGDEGSDGCH